MSQPRSPATTSSVTAALQAAPKLETQPEQKTTEEVFEDALYLAGKKKVWDHFQEQYLKAKEKDLLALVDFMTFNGIDDLADDLDVQAYAAKNKKFVPAVPHVMEFDESAGKKDASAITTMSLGVKTEKIDFSKEFGVDINALRKKHNLDVMKHAPCWVIDGKIKTPMLSGHFTSGGKDDVTAGEQKFIQELTTILFAHGYKKVIIGGDIQVNATELDGKLPKEDKDGRMVASEASKKWLRRFEQIAITQENSPETTTFRRRGYVTPYPKDVEVKPEDALWGQFRGFNFALLNQIEKTGLGEFTAKTRLMIAEPLPETKSNEPIDNSKILEAHVFPSKDAVNNLATGKTISDHTSTAATVDGIRYRVTGGASQKRPKEFKADEESYLEHAFETVLVDGKPVKRIKESVREQEVAYSEKLIHIIIPKLAKLKPATPSAIPNVDTVAIKEPQTSNEYLEAYRKSLRDLGIDPDSDNMMATFDFKDDAKCRKLGVALNKFLQVQAIDQGVEDLFPELSKAYFDSIKEWVGSKEYQEGFVGNVKPEKAKYTSSDEDIKKLQQHSNAKSVGGSGRSPVNRLIQEAVGLEPRGGYYVIAGKENIDSQTAIVTQCYEKCAEMAQDYIDGHEKIVETITENSSTELGKPKDSGVVTELYAITLTSFLRGFEKLQEAVLYRLQQATLLQPQAAKVSGTVGTTFARSQTTAPVTEAAAPASRSQLVI